MDPGLPSLLTSAAEMSVTLSHENARTTKTPHFASAALARASLQGMDGRKLAANRPSLCETGAIEMA